MCVASLAGKSAIVTGGSKGYGYGIAGALKSAGAKVWITGRDRKALNQAARELGVHAVRADVASSKDWDALMDEVVEVAGRLDILVNNAGAGIHIAPTVELHDEEIARVIAINLTGAIYGCRRAGVIMSRQKDGLILNISSVCADHAWPGWGPYSAAKAGLEQYARVLHTELREAGVRVTTITPSWGATEFGKAARIARHTPADEERRRLSMQPKEMGELVLRVCLLPKHLVLPSLRVQPMIQEIIPM